MQRCGDAAGRLLYGPTWMRTTSICAKSILVQWACPGVRFATLLRQTKTQDKPCHPGGDLFILCSQFESFVILVHNQSINAAGPARKSRPPLSSGNVLVANNIDVIRMDSGITLLCYKTCIVLERIQFKQLTCGATLCCVSKFMSVWHLRKLHSMLPVVVVSPR